MSLFRDILHLWHAEDLLAQAWKESREMLCLSQEIFIEAIRHLRESDNDQALMELKKRDWEINTFQKNVRRKVLTHYSVTNDQSDLANGLVLINMVVDIERLGDYTKNIVDLALNYPENIVSENISEDIHTIETIVHSRFAKTVKAVINQDIEIAKSLKASYKYEISKLSDDIVNNILSGELTYGSERTTAAIALYVRYLKRIGSHLNNIATCLVNPFDTIGYAQ